MLVSHSDHLALILKLKDSFDSSQWKCSRVKRFEPHWTKYEDCIELFEKLWLPDIHPSAESVRSNIGSLLDHLLEWNKKKYRDMHSCIRKTRQLLNDLRTKPKWNPKLRLI